MSVKKFLSLILTFAMVISLMPGISPPAEAGTSGGNYTITNNMSSGFDVSGKSDGYPTLKDALEDCNPSGGEGVPNIQFGSDADHPLTITEVDEAHMDANGLRAAVYSGWVHINDESAIGEAGFGLCIDDTSVTFNELTLTTDENTSDLAFAVMVEGSGSLTIEADTSIAASGAGAVALSAYGGTITMTGGAITAEGANSCGISAAYSTVNISGGTISADEGNAIDSAAEGNITITGGTISADNGYAVNNRSTGEITISGGTLTSLQNHCLVNSNKGTVTITGGTISSDSSVKATIYETVSDTDDPSAILISGSDTSITSVCDKTISMTKCGNDGEALYVSLYGTKIHGSFYAAIDIKGAQTSGKSTINSTNYTSATLHASDYRVLSNVTYTFGGWDDAEYGTRISSINGDTISNLTNDKNNIYFEELETYSVKGTVSPGTTGASVSGLTVTLYASSDTAHANALYSGTTDTDGKYTITGVPNGSYVAVVAAGGTSGSFTVSGNKTGINITLVTLVTYSVSGTVSAGTSGASVSGLTVTLYSAGTATGYTATTDSAGKYTMPEVPAGTYAAVVTALTHNQSSSNPITVSDNVSDVDVTLAQYVITYSDEYFHVNGIGEHETLNAALLSCAGATGTTVIQLGDKGIALYLPDLNAAGLGVANKLISATYSGSAQFSRGNLEDYHALYIPTEATVVFDGLTLCDDSHNLHKSNYGVYVSGGSLTVKSGAMTVSGKNDRLIAADSGSVTVQGGTLKAAGEKSIVLYCGGTASALISGGTLEACGESGKGITQFSTGSIGVTGGIVKASYSNTSASEDVAIYISENTGTVAVSGGQVSSTGRQGWAAGIAMFDANNSNLEISGNAVITGDNCAVLNMMTEDTAKGGTVNITGGTLTATGSSAMTILNLKGTFNISGGKVISQGTIGYSCAVLCMSGTSAYPSVVNVSDSAEMSSVLPSTILLFNMPDAGSSDLDSASAKLFDKTIYGSNKASVIISGTAAMEGAPYVINRDNCADTIVSAMADPGNAFLGWTKDAARNSVISTANPDTLSNLTSGANSAVTSIYLKTKTAAAPDYTITNNASGFQVGGNTYATLAQALAVCTNKGSDGVLTIQLGSGSAPLQLTAQSVSDYSANILIPATYTGAVQISGTVTPFGYGLVAGSGSFIFDDLDVSAAVSSTTPFSSVLTSEGATLTIKSGTFSVSGANSRCVENQGTLVINGGTFTSSGEQAYCVYNRNTEGGPATLSVTGGIFSSTGKSSATINNDGKMTVTGGSFTAGNGTAQESVCIKSAASPSTNSVISGGSLISNDPTGCGVYNTRTLAVSGSTEIVSASANTIFMNNSASASTALFGKTLHGSADCDISVMGAASSGGFKIAPSNDTDAALIAHALSSGKSFDAWTSDSALTSKISSINGDTLSALTTGANSAVTDIYLKTGTDTAVVLSSGSLGTAGDSSITGLTAGKKHKVTMGSVTYYVKADGTLSTNAADAAALTGTEIKGLTNGTAYKVEVITESSSGGSYTPPASNNATVIVGGSSQSAGTVETTTQGGKTSTTVTISTDKLKDILAGSGNGATVTIPITTGADTASGRLDGQAVKEMESKDATLVIKTGAASYTLPASEINIDAVSERLGENVSLRDITVNVTISGPSDATVKVVENTAKNGGYSLVVPAVEFTVNCTYGGRTVEVSAFNSYVERLIAIPTGIDPGKITTGIVVDSDGTTHHVPTEVVVVDGVYYAKINSLTNSVYSVIYNPVEFSDVENHWARGSINNMGSRLVVNGVGNNKYEPGRSITRAEFAAIIVKALGLEPGTGKNGFGDVSESAWYCAYVKTASSYGIIKGYDATTFAPNATITREQAMSMVARAMKITGLGAGLTEREASALLAAYIDSASASDYARESIAACLKTGIVSGTGNNAISPKSYVTRAEVAVMAERLLQKSGLI